MTAVQVEKRDTDSESIDTNEAIEELFGFQFEDMKLSDMTMVEESVENDSHNDDQFKTHSSIPSHVRVEHVEIPPNCYRRLNEEGFQYPFIPPTAFYLHSILSTEECESLVTIAGNTPRGFQYVKEAAHTNPKDGSTYTVPLLNPHPHKLSLFQNQQMVQLMWSRLKPILDQYLSKEFIQHFGPPLGLNPRLRVLRYDASDQDYFSPHYDATTTSMSTLNDITSQSRSHQETKLESQLTVLVYLNDGFEGGRTLFLDRSDTSRNMQPINPMQGSILVFDHGLFHSGEAVHSTNGTKFILRSDVMFASPENDNTTLPAEIDKQITPSHFTANTCPHDKNSDMKTIFSQSTKFMEDQPKQTPLFNTILDICMHIKIPQNEIQMLQESDMLDSTVHSFCEPGRDMITMILKESTSMSKESISLLVNKSFEVDGQ